MPVIIAHGQPKSGSTFLYETAIALRSTIDRDEFYTAHAQCMGDVPVFHDHVSADLVRAFLEGAGQKTLIIKTHFRLQPDVRELIESGHVRAFSSFRDPRDTCRSMLDAGISDRAKGDMRYFANFSAVNDWVQPIFQQYRNVQTWTDCEKVLAMPYYITANNQDFAVRMLCTHLGYGAYGRILAAVMQEKKQSLPEFNKGISDRFLTDFSTEEIKFLNGAIGKQIVIYQKLAKEKMAKLGHRMLHDRLVAMRRAALEARGVSEVL